MRERLLREPDQPRNRMLLMFALASLGERDEAVQEWRRFAPLLETSEGPADPDVHMLPLLLLKLGLRAEASRVVDLLSTRDIWPPRPGDLIQIAVAITGGTDDPLYREYRARGQKRYEERLARYGHI